MSSFERFVTAEFSGVVIVQLGLGLYRAHLLHASITPALAFGALLIGVAVLWFVRRRGMRGAALARPAALLFATVAGLSAMSAFNAPLLGFLARFGVPIFALTVAGVLIVAEQPPRIQALPLFFFLLGFTAVELVLMHDARWEATN
jgi:hypothetical protein